MDDGVQSHFHGKPNFELSCGCNNQHVRIVESVVFDDILMFEDLRIYSGVVQEVEKQSMNYSHSNIKKIFSAFFY